MRRKATPDPNIVFDLLLTLLNRDNEAEWRDHFREAVKRTSRVLTRNLREPWRPTRVMTVNPVPPEKVGLLSMLPADMRAKVKPKQWHEPTDFYKPLCDLADLLIEHGPGKAAADAFNHLAIDHNLLAVPQVFWHAERFIPAWQLRPGGATDIFVVQFSDILLSRWASRLRQCPTCKLYFIDQTRNGRKLRCSPRCTNVLWSRILRRRRTASRKPNVSRSRPV